MTDGEFWQGSANSTDSSSGDEDLVLKASWDGQEELLPFFYELKPFRALVGQFLEFRYCPDDAWP